MAVLNLIRTVGRHASRLSLVTLAMASCSDQSMLVSPSDATHENGPGTSSRVDASQDKSVRSVVPLSQSATLITFSELPIGTSISDQYNDVGILFGGSSPFIATDADNPTSPVLSGTPLFQGAITGAFVVPGTSTPTTVESFSLDAGYFDEIGTTELRWFDSSGVVIGSQTNTGLGIQTLTATAPEIASWSIQIVSSEPAGYAIDNVQFVAEGPLSLACLPATVVRGAEVTCTLSGGPVESVEKWTFTGSIEGSSIEPITDTGAGTTWIGKAVLSGTVSVEAMVSGSSETTTAQLQVDPRELSDAAWKWDLPKWNYVPGGGDVTCPQVPGFGLFTTAYSGELGVNLSTDTCQTQSITPNTADPNRVFGPAGQGGVTPEEVPDGPNTGLWYVKEAHYTMDRASIVSSDLGPSAGEHNLSGADLSLCQSQGLASPSTANFYEYNVTCRGQLANIQAFLAGVEDHEGLGEVALFIGSRASGHESVRRWVAGGRDLVTGYSNPWDPYAAVEGIVRESEAFLKSAVGLAVNQVDVDISTQANQHALVNGNWCGDAWKYQPGPTVGTGTFVFVPITHVSGLCL